MQQPLFIMIAALCECFRFAADFNPSQRLFLFCRGVGEKFIHPPGDATAAANGSVGSFLLPCTAAICYTKEKTEGEALRMTRIAIVEDEPPSGSSWRGMCSATRGSMAPSLR